MVVTPTSGGTLQLKIPSTATLTDIAGNSLVVTPEIFDDKVINVTSGTTLTVGDILFTGMRVVDPDYFSFVLLKDVVDGTSLIVTDNRWTGTSLTVNEGNATFVVQNNGNGLKAGTHLVYESGATTPFRVVETGASAGTVTIAGSFALSTSGDSLLAYQGLAPTDPNAANWIAGINSKRWDSPLTTNDSLRPTALDAAAIELTSGTGDIDYGFFRPPVFVGTISEIRASVLNIANWQVSATAAILPIATRFYVGSSSSQVFINEVVFDPIAATDTGQEYIELRGDPGTFVPADAYLVLLDGDSEDGNGNIDHIFYIAGCSSGPTGI